MSKDLDNNDFFLKEDPSDDELMESQFFEKNLDTQTIFLEIDPDDEEDAEEKAEKKKSKAKKSENKPVSDDSVFLYLREIGKIPTLNNEQEIIVTRSIRKGGVDGEKAKRQLVQSNLRLVVSIAKRYASNNIQLLDLIQEGNLGLMKAADKFDASRGYKFSTFATWWIRQSISRSIADKSRTIRIPVHMIEQASKLRKIIAEMTHSLGRSPSEEEIMMAMDISKERLFEIQNLQMKTVSIATKVSGDDDNSTTIADFIETTSTYD